MGGEVRSSHAGKETGKPRSFRKQPEIDKAQYDTHRYYSLADGKQVLAAHRALAQKYQSSPNTSWYWMRTDREEPSLLSYHEELVGFFTIITGQIEDMPLSTLASVFDSTSKSYLDQRALGKKGIEDADRKKEISRFNSLAGRDLLVTAVVYKGFLVGGSMRDIGEGQKTIGEILQNPKDGTRHLSVIAELAHADFKLPENHALYNVPENVIAEGKRYYAVPFPQLQSFSGLSDEQTKNLRDNIRIAIAAGSLHAAERWMRKTGRTIRYVIGETPNPTLQRESREEIDAGKAIFITELKEQELYGKYAIIPDRIHLVTAREFSVVVKDAEEKFVNAFPETITS